MMSRDKAGSDPGIGVGITVSPLTGERESANADDVSD